jgi:FkbM family methyltransferase
LQASKYVVWYEPNTGPWINPWVHAERYKQLPDEFVLTDADLEFNDNLPADFVVQLSNLGKKLQCAKIGFALQISDADKFLPGFYVRNENKDYTIAGWESQFWQTKIAHEKYEMYRAAIDTTFCLCRKSQLQSGFCVRVAGSFTARHLPWYKESKLFTPYERFMMYTQQDAKISTASRMILSDLRSRYVVVNKHDQQFLIKKDDEDPNLGFWRDTFANWEPDTFRVFDSCLKPTKICLDLGGWIGTTCLYASRKSKLVYVVEPDPVALRYLSQNIAINHCAHNTIVLDRAVHREPDLNLRLTRNAFLPQSKLGDSTSQAVEDQGLMGHVVRSCSVKSLLQEYKLDLADISLVKVDIEGGEEVILQDLFDAFSGKVAMYISFHYTWWKNADLSRFGFLSKDQQAHLRNAPFCSLFFPSKV